MINSKSDRIVPFSGEVIIHWSDDKMSLSLIRWVENIAEKITILGQICGSQSNEDECTKYKNIRVKKYHFPPKFGEFGEGIFGSRLIHHVHYLI